MNQVKKILSSLNQYFLQQTTSAKKSFPPGIKQLVLFWVAVFISVFVLFIGRQLVYVRTGAPFNSAILGDIFTYTLGLIVILFAILFIVTLTCFVVLKITKHNAEFGVLFKSILLIVGTAFLFDKITLFILTAFNLFPFLDNVNRYFIGDVERIILCGWQALYISEIIRTKFKLSEKAYLLTVITFLVVVMTIFSS